jgi:polyferredoxin
MTHPVSNRRQVRSPGRWQAFGDLLQRKQAVVARIQWAFAALYVLLLVGPAVLPPPAAQVGVFDSLARFSEALFWGIWWPAVLLATLVFGQFWCGVLCPDGMLTEFSSRHGRGAKIPRWLRRAGWPMLGFALLMTYEQLTDAYRSPLATLALLGGCSVAAIVCGALVGRGKRVWCRYLCPLANVFALLSRCALLHFRVDRPAWDSAPRRRSAAVDCPLLLDVRRLNSNEKCNMCARCSGHCDAVALALRGPGGEIVALGAGQGEARRWEALVIAFVLVGLSFGAQHWRGSPWCAAITAAQPGWPPALVAATALLLPALLVGGSLALLLLLAGVGSLQRSVRLAYALIPLAGIGLFLGSLEYSLEILAREGIALGHWLPAIRASFLLPALAWSMMLGDRQLRREAIGAWRRRGALAIYLSAAILLAGVYQFVVCPL